jgi:hypothetical protein
MRKIATHEYRLAYQEPPLDIVHGLLFILREGNSWQTSLPRLAGVAACATRANAPSTIADGRDVEKTETVDKPEFAMVDSREEVAVELKLPMKLDVGDSHGPTSRRREGRWRCVVQHRYALKRL